MKISERSVAAFAKIVTGASKILPSRSGPALVRLFNEFGANDVYRQGFPSRFAVVLRIRENPGTEWADRCSRIDLRDS